MLALPLRLPTAPYGGHMGHFLLSMLMLSGSAPFGNTNHDGPTMTVTYCLGLYDPVVTHQSHLFTPPGAPSHYH